jgi:hypothetical protein
MVSYARFSGTSGAEAYRCDAGFTETSFNFQQDNLGNGGQANDRVTISVQDASGFEYVDIDCCNDQEANLVNLQ